MRSGEPTRRSFLNHSIGALAAITAASSLRPLFSQEKASEKPLLRWGIIGTGHRAAAAHIPAIKGFSEFEIVGACDVDAGRLQNALKRIGRKVESYTDYQKLLANPDINAVIIATPNCVHKECVVAALQAGKHVMCEKPMACTIDECKAMKQAAEERPKQIVLYTMQLRYASFYQELRKQIDAGVIGNPRLMTFIESRGDWNTGNVWKYDDPKIGLVNWRFSHAASGGTLSEKVCHYFDILNWMAGANPQRVMCSGGISVYKDGRDTWDHASTTLEYPGELQATHTLCMFGPKRMDFQVVGDEGALTVLEKSLLLEAKGKKQEIELPAEIRHGERGPAKEMETAVVRMYQDFIDCVKNSKQPWMDANKAMASAKVAWLGELSNERKQEVRWDELG